VPKYLCPAFKGKGPSPKVRKKLWLQCRTKASQALGCTKTLRKLRDAAKAKAAPRPGPSKRPAAPFLPAPKRAKAS
jgi:hypothetical protein